MRGNGTLKEGDQSQDGPGALCSGGLSWARISSPWLGNLLSPPLKSQRGKSRPPGLARPCLDHREDVCKGRSVDCNGFCCKLYPLLVSNSCHPPLYPPPPPPWTLKTEELVWILSWSGDRSQLKCHLGWVEWVGCPLCFF